MVFDLREKTVIHRLGILFGVEQRLDVALDDREWRAQLVADVGDKLLPQILQPLHSCQVVEHQDCAAMNAVLLADRHAVGLQESLLEIWQHELLLLDATLHLEPLDQVVGLMDADGLHHGLAAGVFLQVEQSAERLVCKLDSAVGISDQDALRHVCEHPGHADRLG